ncbi:WYL domain-containing protein [Chryseolinea sp. H1M3-3]|uniref:helix-turn-helix transcriptional regulator n=1 Tax=Chryseolinea sp. H1M3-3 TaxID=3034144 RepID=UPI0023ECE3D2|nr:WYL domain-containing protein [Chryseolinea sp. H1M3-3]
MANGKFPYFRYRIIHACLASKHKTHWTIEELMEKLMEQDLVVSKRSVEADLHTMRHDERLGYNAPIKYCRKNLGYYYTDPDYSIERVPLNAKDQRALTFAINTLKKYKDFPLVHQFQGLVEKLGRVVDSQQHESIISFETVPYQKGIEHLDPLINAILDKQPLRLEYKKFTGKSDVHTFHPYFLKEYKNRWYVRGYSEKIRFYPTLGLDRIENFQPASVMYKPNKKTDQDAYFKHTIGITLGKGSPEEVRLYFSPMQANYIKTQFLHHTQEVVQDDAHGLVIKLMIIPNYELLQLLLGFGSEVEVLGPEKLREQMKEMVGKMGERYK